MTEMLSATVRERTRLDGRYRESASHQSMQAFLDDWVAARARLDRQIAELTVMVERRKQQVRSGEWPPEHDTVSPRRCDRCDGTDFLCSALNGDDEPVWLCRDCISAMTGNEPPAEDRVVDLMAALEQSVAEAKAARQRHVQAKGGG